MSIDRIVTRSDCRGMVTLLSSLEHYPTQRAATVLLGHTDAITICTGFPVNGRPETDGLVGTIVLARALQETGKHVRIASWGAVLDILWPLVPTRLEPIFIPTGRAAPQRLSGPCVMIECCGRTAAGTYLNMRAHDITASTPWFETACGLHCSVCVGDGGNEFGMGSAPKTWFDAPQRNICPPSSTCDVLVPSEVSNWGAIGITAQISLLCGKRLLPTASAYLQLLEAVVAAGAVDGVTGQATATEDAKTVHETINVVEELRGRVNEYLLPSST